MRKTTTLLASLFTLLAGCATQDAGLDYAAIDANPKDDAEPVAEREAPYPEASFDFRLELGGMDPEAPVASVWVDSVTAVIDGVPVELTLSDANSPVELATRRIPRWSPVYQGTLETGRLESMSIRLGMEATVEDGETSWDSVVTYEDRNVELGVHFLTDHDLPVVLTVLYQPEEVDGEVELNETQVLLRCVDTNGYTFPFHKGPEEQPGA